MTQIGCFIGLALLALLLSVGGVFGLARGRLPLGIAWGGVVWLTVTLAYLCALSIVDWRQQQRRPLIGVPRSVVVAIWLSLVVMGSLTGYLTVRMFAIR